MRTTRVQYRALPKAAKLRPTRIFAATPSGAREVAMYTPESMTATVRYLRNSLAIAASVLFLTLQGCNALPSSCDPSPETASLDPENVIPEATGAGGSQSLGAGSNVNGPEVSSIEAPPCLAGRSPALRLSEGAIAPETSVGTAQ
jgi:hypothetical protein